jgi:hypothetical protein
LFRKKNDDYFETASSKHTPEDVKTTFHCFPAIFFIMVVGKVWTAAVLLLLGMREKSVADQDSVIHKGRTIIIRYPATIVSLKLHLFEIYLYTNSSNLWLVALGTHA